MIARLIAVLALAVACFPGDALAQNAGGVFGPKVIPGRRAVDFRYTADDPATGGAFVLRTHYEQAVGNNLMWRVVGQVRQTREDGEFEADYARADLFWYLGQPVRGWYTGLRFDAMVRAGNRPEQININWTNEWNLTDATIARFVVRVAPQFGAGAKESPLLETRSLLSHRLRSGAVIGLESYHPWGELSELDGIARAPTQVGSYVTVPVGNMSVFTGVLFGFTDAAPDTTIRLRVVRVF